MLIATKGLILAFAVALLAVQPALAQEVAVKMTVEQLRLQQQLNDAAVQKLGKSAARAVVFFDELYEKAINEAQKPQEPKQ
jgi:hypothetical protein